MLGHECRRRAVVARGEIVLLAEDKEAGIILGVILNAGFRDFHAVDFSTKGRSHCCAIWAPCDDLDCPDRATRFYLLRMR